MNTVRYFVYLVVLAALCCASAHAADIELSDCNILIGKKMNTAYNGWLKDNPEQGEAGDSEAICLRRNRGQHPAGLSRGINHRR